MDRCSFAAKTPIHTGHPNPKPCVPDQDKMYLKHIHDETCIGLDTPAQRAPVNVACLIITDNVSKFSQPQHH